MRSVPLASVMPRVADVAQIVLVMNDIVDSQGAKDPLPEDGGGCACTLS